MSPWVTISRRSVARYSPGTCCQTSCPSYRRSRSCDPARGRQEDAPAVFRHLHVAVGRPALGVDRGRGAQIDIGRLEVRRAHLLPPIQKLRLPVLQRALQRAIRAEIDVVRNALLIVDAITLFPIESRLGPGAEQLERAVFAHGIGANENPVLPGRETSEDFRLQGLAPANRRFASRPVNASGDSAGALLDRESNLVFPVEFVGRGRDEPEFNAWSGPSGLPFAFARSCDNLFASPLKRVSRRCAR